MSVNKARKSFINKLKELEISDNVIESFENIDQAIFFDSIFKEKYYGDQVIPVGYGEKSDNFLMLARMIDFLGLTGKERVLEIGTGSGYSTSILSSLSREVLTVEYKENLAMDAKNRLYSYDFENIRFYAGDATEPENSYGDVDAIIIHCACYKRPLTVMQDLKPGGVIVFPMGPATGQQVIKMINEPDIEMGQSFKVSFHQQGVFPLIIGKCGYDNENFIMTEFGDEVDTSGVERYYAENDPELFVPPAEEEEE